MTRYSSGGNLDVPCLHTDVLRACISRHLVNVSVMNKFEE